MRPQLADLQTVQFSLQIEPSYAVAANLWTITKQAPPNLTNVGSIWLIWLRLAIDSVSKLGLRGEKRKKNRKKMKTRAATGSKVKASWCFFDHQIQSRELSKATTTCVAGELIDQQVFLKKMSTLFCVAVQLSKLAHLASWSTNEYSLKKTSICKHWLCSAW